MKGMIMDKKMLDEMIRAPFASMDPSFGSAALADATWNAIKGLLKK